MRVSRVIHGIIIIHANCINIYIQYIKAFYFISYPVVYESNNAEATGNTPCTNGYKFSLNVVSEISKQTISMINIKDDCDN